MLKNRIIVINNASEIYDIGVYKLFHVDCPEVIYVGSCKIRRNKRGKSGFYRRFTNHYYAIRSLKARNKTLQAHINNLGINGLRMAILELCDSDKAIEREQFFIDTLAPTLNICRKAGNSEGFKHSADTLAHLSKIKMGRRLSTEARKKISCALKGRPVSNLATWHSAASRQKASAKLKGKIRSREYYKDVIKAVQKLDLNGIILKEYSSLTEAAKENGVTVCSISNCLAGRRQTCAGFKWVAAKELGLSESRLT